MKSWIQTRIVEVEGHPADHLVVSAKLAISAEVNVFYACSPTLLSPFKKQWHNQYCALNVIFFQQALRIKHALCRRKIISKPLMLI